MADLFDGETYDAPLDENRLSRQLDRVRNLMLDGKWRTLFEIEQATGAPETSVSARLRDLRKIRFGNYCVERRRRGLPHLGLHEYRVTIPKEEA